MSLVSVFECLRRVLASAPQFYVAFAVNTPAVNAPKSVACTSYGRFLTDLSDGGRFGVVDLWSVEELSTKQFRSCEPERLLEIGQILYEPLVLDLQHDSLSWVRESSGTVILGHFETFLQRYVFGERYREIAAADDDLWLSYLEADCVQACLKLENAKNGDIHHLR